MAASLASNLRSAVFAELRHLSRCPSDDRPQLSLAPAALSGARCAGLAQSVCRTWATGGATNVAEPIAKTFLNPRLAALVDQECEITRFCRGDRGLERKSQSFLDNLIAGINIEPARSSSPPTRSSGSGVSFFFSIFSGHPPPRRVGLPSADLNSSICWSQSQVYRGNFW